MGQPGTWNDLLAAKQVRQHKTTLAEINQLREVVKRDLQDSKISELSADRRFATAYNAVLQLTKMAIACAGYRVAGLGHHQTTFVALDLALGPQRFPYSVYFDGCRRKRNHVDYDMANVATEGEADELIEKAEEFAEVVESWIAKNYLRLKR